MSRFVFALVVQVTVLWCVCGTSQWRLPHGLPPPPPLPVNLQKTAAFQMAKDFYREKLLASKNNTASWPNPIPQSQPLSVPIINRPTTPLNGSSNSYKNFYRVFYGSHDNLALHKLKKPPEITTAKPTNARIMYGSNHDPHHLPQVLEDVRQANEHFLRIRNLAKCNIPKPKVIKVRDHYPDQSKEYLPRCTILYRCGDDSSCCDNDDFQCVATRIQEVTLHFYAIRVPTKYGMSVNPTNSVEKLLFENHTACECQPINDLPRANRSPDPLVVAPTTQTTTTVTMSPTTSMEQIDHPTQEEPLANHLHPSKCRECPVPFSRRDFSDGRCSCDCFDRHKPCLKIKRGRDPLNEVERRCVEVTQCHIPECEYGDYDYDTGRCPKKPENYRKLPDSKEYQNHHHRWNFFERD